MILVTGATGHLGSATINQLLKHTPAENIAAFARDEEKAKLLADKGVDVRIGTFDDRPSLDKAMKGIEEVLLISTVDHHRFQQHQNVVDAAKQAGAKHIGYTGVTIKNVDAAATRMLMESHFQTEEYIKASGLGYTFFRNTLYADMIPIYVGDKVFETGINFPAGDGKVAYALRREMGEAIANALLQKDAGKRAYEITGSELYSYEDVAKVLSELAGKAITYQDIDATQHSSQLEKAGVPEPARFIVKAFSADIKAHQFEIASKDLGTLLGRKPASLKDALKELYRL